MKQSFNPALMLTLGIPALAIVASFLTLGLAIARPDRELPEQYHWEGLRLDRDFEQAKEASLRHVRAELSRDTVTHTCRLVLQMEGVPPEQLLLTLTHATQSALDRKLAFKRSPLAGTYEAPCDAFPTAHWRVELSEPLKLWSVRQSVQGSLNAWKLSAAPL